MPANTMRLFVLLLAALLCACSHNPADDSPRVCFKESCFTVEIVSKDEERMRGLQHRTSLAQDAGMLFLFEESAPHHFWMKDTLIPLDMIWMDYARRVIFIEHDVPPCGKDPCPTYGPRDNALYVLEINAGQARAEDIKKGDQAVFTPGRAVHP